MKDNRFGAAYAAWKAGSTLRERRRRYKRFTYGDQWGDVVLTPRGEHKTEEALALESGKRPLTNNMIRQLVKSVVGRFRYRVARGDDRVAGVDEETASRNLLDELDSRMLEEFLISGCAVQRVVSERRMQGDGVWVDNVSPDRFFVNRFSDPRSGDIELVGMLHDMSLREVMMRYGHGALSAEEIERIYRRDSVREGSVAAGVSLGEAAESDFFAPGDASRCRVIEVWTLEARAIAVCSDPETGQGFTVAAGDAGRLERINCRRGRLGLRPIRVNRRMTARWHCTCYTPGATVLYEGDSPWGHGMHPFVVKFFPMTDGEVHSFVEDVIDQQRYVNRLITLIDHIMSSSAKGALLFPIESFVEELGWDAVVRNWSNPDGIIPYYGNGGLKPEQLTPKSGTAGAGDLLALEMKMMEQISGVSGALQGQMPTSVTSATTYNNSIENASIALLDIFETFRSFRDARNRLIAGVRG